MSEVALIDQIRTWAIRNGWHEDSNTGRRIKLGDGVTLGDWVTLGDEVTLGDGATLGNEVTLGDWVTLGDGVTLGDRVMLGDGVTLGDRVTLGDWVMLGNEVKLGDRVTLGDRVKLGDWVMLGNEVKLGDRVTLGDRVKLGDGVTSDELHNFDGGTTLEYRCGAIVEAEGEKNDQQCAAGLHVLRKPYRPEWVGLCDADHNLIPLDVEVRSEDVLFAGLPTMDAKVRVRRLRVLT